MNYNATPMKDNKELMGPSTDKFSRPELGGVPAVKIDTQVLESIKGFWSIKENIWKPPVRIGSTLTVCGNRLFLFGGYNKMAMNDVMYLE